MALGECVGLLQCVRNARRYTFSSHERGEDQEHLGVGAIHSDANGGVLSGRHAGA